MINKEEQFIYYFETGGKGPQIFFQEIIKTALTYKYKNSLKPPLISDQEITNAIFSLAVTDSLKLFEKTINGQRITELFIVSIYLKYLDAFNKDKVIIIALPFVEESYDIAVYITKKENLPSENNDGKLKLRKDFDAYYIQIKEEFDYRASQEGYKELKQNLNITALEKKSLHYDELVLIFMRDYAIYSSTQTSAFLEKNKNVGLIIMPSLNPKKVQITGGKDQGKFIPLEEGKYNFLLNSQGQTAHIMYDIPNFLIPKEDLIHQ